MGLTLVPTPIYASYLDRIECRVLRISEFVVKNADCLDWDAVAHPGRRRQPTSSARF